MKHAHVHTLFLSAPGGPMFSSEKHKKNSSNDDMSSNATEDNPEDKILSVAGKYLC